MKYRIAGWLLAVLLPAWLGMSAHADFTMEDIRNQAVQGAVDKAQAELAGVQAARNKTVAVLPFVGGYGLGVESRLLTALTRAGFTAVDAKNDPLWEEIAREVEFGERKADILDPDTLVKFGKLKGVQAVLYGSVMEITHPGRMCFVEIEAHLSSLETREHLWGGRFAERRFAAEALRGFVKLDALARAALQKAVAEAVKSAADAPALSRDTKAALLPLAGDFDRYATHLVKDALTATGKITLRELDLRTIGEARALLRDKPAMATALLVGAVRDISPRQLVADEGYRRVYRAEGEVQISIENAATGDILWSGTGRGVAEEKEEDSWLSVLLKLVRERPNIFIGIGIFIVVAIVWRSIKRAATRVR